MPERIAKVASLLVVTLLLLGLLSCGVEVKQTRRLPPEQVLPLRTATLEELLKRLEEQAAAVTSINAVAELVASTGSAYSGVIEQYHDVRVFVLAQRWPREADDSGGSGVPGRQVRLIGQAPVLRKNIFDMVADEERFRIFIPSKNKFILGPTQLRRRNEKPIENLRPQHLFDALFLVAPTAENQHFLEENEFGGVRYYAVSEIVGSDEGGIALQRKWWFERSRLALVRVQHFENEGQLVADIRYADWPRDKAAPYPAEIELVRPLEDYRLKLLFKELALNQPLTPAQFRLERPAGAEVVELTDEPPPEALP